MSAAELRGQRAQLREELERALIDHPHATEQHARLMRLLSWNRRELQMAQRRATKAAI